MTAPCADVSGRLRALADEVAVFDAGTADRTRRLADALSDPMAAALWLGLDAMQVVAPQRLADGVPTHWLVRGIDWARNAAMLLPIVITWLGIALAVSAYNAAVSADTGLGGESFLYLWATGFGNHPHAGWTLPELAFADVAVVAGILVLLGAHPLLERWLSGGRAARARELSTRLQSAVADASLCLTRVLQADNAEPGAAPASAVAVIRATAEVALRLERVLDGQSRIGEQLSGALHAVSDASRQVAAESATLRGVADALTSTQSQFLQELARERAAHSGLVDGLTQVASGLNHNLRAIDEQARPVHELATRLAQLSTQIPPLLDTVRKAQQQVWNEQASAAESMRSATLAMEDVARSVQRLAARAAMDGAAP
jgi:hypothetical protein